MDPLTAYQFSSRHRADLEASTICGCFHCLEMFPPAEIKDWMEEEGKDTALCPRCGIDAVIGDASGVAVNFHQLVGMQSLFFGESEE